MEGFFRALLAGVFLGALWVALMNERQRSELGATLTAAMDEIEDMVSGTETEPKPRARRRTTRLETDDDQ